MTQRSSNTGYAIYTPSPIAARPLAVRVQHTFDAAPMQMHLAGQAMMPATTVLRAAPRAMISVAQPSGTPLSNIAVPLNAGVQPRNAYATQPTPVLQSAQISRSSCQQLATRCVVPAAKTVLEPTLTGGPTTCEEVAFVTGGNTGIGKEIARKLLSVGMRVVLGCLDLNVGAIAVQELQKIGGQVACVHLELCSVDTMQAAHDFILHSFGRLDVLVNCAAICYNDPTLYGKCEYTPFEKQARITVETNFLGTLNVIRTMLPLLRAAPSARIVTISSSAGRLAILKSQEKVAQFTSPTLQVDQIEKLMRQFVVDVETGVHASNGWGHTCYGMSKLGLIALSQVLAREEPNIMVNCADPGYCATEMNAFHGYDPPEKGAHTAALLALLGNDQWFSGKIWWKEAEHTW